MPGPRTILIIGGGRRKRGDATDRSIAVPGFGWSSEPSSGSGDPGVEQRIYDIFERWVDGVEAGDRRAAGE